MMKAVIFFNQNMLNGLEITGRKGIPNFSSRFCESYDVAFN